MKSILYVGATLMIGASIYGFADYTKTRNKKEFKDMYAEKELTQPVVEKKHALVSTEKIEIPADDKKTADVKANESNNAKTGKPVVKVRKKKRTFSTKLFSRGALDEKYIEKEIKLEEPKTKTEPSKTENKEQ